MSYRKNIEDLMLDLNRKCQELRRDYYSSSDDYERGIYRSRIDALEDEIYRLDCKLRCEVEL